MINRLNEIRERAAKARENYQSVRRNDELYKVLDVDIPCLLFDIARLAGENSDLRDALARMTDERGELSKELEAAKEDMALIPTICYGDCTGDSSVGVPNCPFYDGPYTHWEAGLPIADGCRYAPKRAENGGAK